MPIAEVHLSGPLVSEFCATGFSPPKFSLTKGVSPEAKLQKAFYDPGSDILVLQFEVDKPVDNPVVMEAQNELEIP